MSTEIYDIETPLTKTDTPHGIRHENVRAMDLRPFICVAPDTSLAQAFEQMKHAEIDAIFVCEDGHVTGIFSRHEVLACTGDGTLNTARPVRDFMVTAFAQLTSDATIGQVVETMNERAVHHVAIADNGNFIGAISDLDIVTFLVESYPKETMNLPPVTKQAMDTREGE